MSNVCILTTIDNPFDPFEQFTSWFLFDAEKGYKCCSILDRILTKNNVNTDELSEDEVNEAVEQAIDEIIAHDFTDTYIKVTRKTKDT